jgi:hypothetical protein
LENCRLSAPAGDRGALRECYLVALPQKDAALAVLRMRHGFDDAELEVAGEAPAEMLEWLDIKPGQIFRVSAVT